MAGDLGQSGEDLAVVEADDHVQAQLGKDGIEELGELGLAEQGIGADHVRVALVKLVVAALLRPVGAPDGGNGVALEGEGQVVLVHDHVAGEGHGEVVAQAPFGDLGEHGVAVLVGQVPVVGLTQKVAVVEHLEEQAVPLFAVLAGEGREVFHHGRLDRLEAVAVEVLADDVEEEVAPPHFVGEEIAGALRNGWFQCRGGCWWGGQRSDKSSVASDR